MAWLPQAIFDFLIADRCLMCRREYSAWLGDTGGVNGFAGCLTGANPVRWFRLIELANHPVCPTCARYFESSAGVERLATINETSVELPDGSRFSLGAAGRKKPPADEGKAPEPGIITIIAPFLINDAVLQLVHLFKFSSYRSLAGPMAEAMAAAINCFAPAGNGSAVLVPVPLSRQKRRERGYNQATLICHALSRRLGLAVGNRALRRIRPGQQQSKTDRRQRAANVRGAFEADRSRVAGRHIDLVDDLVTSGSTAAACAAALLAEGADRVRVLSFGRFR
jgi:ComF family protein